MLISNRLRKQSPPHFIFRVLISLFLVTACDKEAHDKNNFRTIPQERIDGSFLIEADPGIADADQLTTLQGSVKATAEEFGCSVGTLDNISWEPSGGVLSSDLSRVYHLQLKECELADDELRGVLDSLSEKEGIKMAEAEALVKTTADNDQYRNRQYWMDQINRDQACNIAGNGSEVVVAVVDSGVDFDHPDLVNQFYRDKSGRVIGANFVGKGSRGRPDSNWDDGNSHGTHVAGIIAAESNNGKGIAGTGSCLPVKIMPIKVMGADGTGSSIEIDRGIQWAAANGADIINLSLGSTAVGGATPTRKKSLYSSLARQGVIVFAAAGNDGRINGARSGRGYLWSYPATYEYVISVASTDSRGQFSRFSNRGPYVDIAAPGSDILSTVPGGSYRNLSGTSMATPVAVGAWAFVYSSVAGKMRQPFNYDQVMSFLLDSTSDRYSLNSSQVNSGGLLDMEKLLAQVAIPEEEPAEPEQPEQSEPAPQQPDEPATEQPEEPEEPAYDPNAMNFVGLQPGMQLRGASRFGVSNWPRGTYRIYLYWQQDGASAATTFTSLDSFSLSYQDTLITYDSYYLYGKGRLYAEAVSFWGRRLRLDSIPLKGL